MDFRGLLPEDFIQEVIEYVMMAASECGDKAGQITRILHGQGSHLQTGDPTFCA